jgi:hypothetical protein
LSTYIRLGRKLPILLNALAYYGAGFITSVKSFKVPVPVLFATEALR